MMTRTEKIQQLMNRGAELAAQQAAVAATGNTKLAAELAHQFQEVARQLNELR